MDHIACLCLAAVIYNMDTSDNTIPRHQIYYVIQGECTVQYKDKGNTNNSRFSIIL